MAKTMIIVLAVPFSAVGAVWLLYALGYNVSIGVWVGLIALMGVDAETAVFMILAAEGDNHPQHGHRLMDDGQRLPFHAFDFVQALLDVLDVIANRVIEERHHRQREQGQLWVNEKGDPEHLLI